MAWIQLHQAVWTHRKTFVLASSLDIDETAAGGYLARLWCWALDNAVDGRLPDQARAVAFGAGWRGEPVMFLDALIEAGWVDVRDGYWLHDWSEYGGKLSERRTADTERKRSGRTADVQRMSDGFPTDGVRTAYVDKRRVEKSRKDPLEATASPKLKRATVRCLTDEQRTVITSEFRDIPAVSEEIDRALAHVAASKSQDMNLYVRGWLRRTRERMPVTANGSQAPPRVRVPDTLPVFRRGE